MAWFGRNKKSSSYDVIPEETFVDALNVSSMDEQQMEGFIEQSLPQRVTWLFAWIMIVVLVLFGVQLMRLQVFQGAEFFTLAERNRLFQDTLFAQRGVIYDYNQVPLAWNGEQREDESFARRGYINDPGFSHVLGYVNYPQKDDNGFYWRKAIVGKAGLELLLQERLAGINGARLVERDALMQTFTDNLVRQPIDGENITTTLDADLQARVHRAMADIVENDGYQGAAAVFMNVDDGGVRVLTNYPEYDSTVLAHAEDQETIAEFLTSERGYFLNRATSGLYSPGSTIKPFVALAALAEGVIDQTTTIMSIGRIEVPNPYDPDNPSIFRDWRREGHGMANVEFAIADSVNTFFYAISGGYGDQEGIGIDAIASFLDRFAIAQPTGFEMGGEAQGVIPTPAWKRKVFDDAWRLGDTYITSIGQFGFQVTPLQMVRGVGVIANDGYLVTPRILEETPVEKKPVLDLDFDDMELVRSGMRQTVTRGTAQQLKTLGTQFAVKTGTAQVSVREGTVNSWVVGMYPYENPEVAFAIVLERGPNEGARSAASVVRQAFSDQDSLYQDIEDDSGEYEPEEEPGLEGLEEVLDELSLTTLQAQLQ